MNPPAFDSERLTFLGELDRDCEIEVTDWEAGFIESALKFSSTAPVFSDKQRAVVNRLWCRYGPRLHPRVKAATLDLPETEPGKCAWLLTREGQARQSRCNLPVATGKNFCADHQAERERVQAQMRSAKQRRP